MEEENGSLLETRFILKGSTIFTSTIMTKFIKHPYKMGPGSTYKWSYGPLKIGLYPQLPIYFWLFIGGPLHPINNDREGARVF